MAYETILFDIDGTLCDPGNSITESARIALATLGVNEKDEHALRRFVGPPLEHTFKDLYGFDNETTKKAVKIFRDNMQGEGISLYTAYDGIEDLLKELAQAGKTLCIVTSKIDHIARLALEATQLIDYFTIIGAQQPHEVVKKEIILARVLEEVSVESASIVMVGDRMHDIEAAKACGIASIGVLYGYGTRTELETEGATHIAETTVALRELLI